MARDKIVEDLEKVLRERYGFKGSLAGVEFSSQTNDSFPLLIEVLTNSAPPIPDTITSQNNDPKRGDPAFVYWYGHGWFTATIETIETATIETWLPRQLSYMARWSWTDGDWAPVRASYDNVCVDKVPDPATLGVGTKVLFKQGLYFCGLNDYGMLCDSSGWGLSERRKRELAARLEISDRWHTG